MKSIEGFSEIYKNNLQQTINIPVAANADDRLVGSSQIIFSRGRRLFTC
jgi:hypothetical protein